MDRSEFADDVFPDDLWEPDPDDNSDLVDYDPSGFYGDPRAIAEFERNLDAG